MIVSGGEPIHCERNREGGKKTNNKKKRADRRDLFPLHRDLYGLGMTLTDIIYGINVSLSQSQSRSPKNVLMSVKVKIQ